jgi:hypothetical protein
MVKTMTFQKYIQGIRYNRRSYETEYYKIPILIHSMHWFEVWWNIKNFKYNKYIHLKENLKDLICQITQVQFFQQFCVLVSKGFKKNYIQYKFNIINTEKNGLKSWVVRVI